MDGTVFNDLINEAILHAEYPTCNPRVTKFAKE